jgi:hypothetical protein
LRPSRCKTYSRSCFPLMSISDSSKSKLIDNKNKKRIILLSLSNENNTQIFRYYRIFRRDFQ